MSKSSTKQPLKIVKADIHFQTLAEDGTSVEFTYSAKDKTFHCHRNFLDAVDIEILGKLSAFLPDCIKTLENIVNGAVTSGDAILERK